MSKENTTSSPPTVFIGIDWADTQHAFHIIEPDGSKQVGSFQQSLTICTVYRLLFAVSRCQVGDRD
ncbi:MAG: hypothetical protein R3C05_18965 [Pirellulaceae bacterium]